MLKFKSEYNKAKNYVIDYYDIVACSGDDVEEESDFFTCPECNYPLYASDYDDNWEETAPWTYCPNCGFHWFNEEE